MSRNVEMMRNPTQARGSQRKSEMFVIPMEMNESPCTSSTERHGDDEYFSFSRLKDFLSTSNAFEMQWQTRSLSYRMKSLNETFPRPIDEPCKKYRFRKDINCCLLGCWTSRKTRQTLDISDGDYKVTIVYKPRVCLRFNTTRVLDIFIPETAERIGWIETETSVVQSSIYVKGNPVPFTMKLVPHARTPIYVPILDSGNQIVGVGQASLWDKDMCHLVEGITRFHLSIGEFDTQTKAVLLASLVMMVHDL